MKNSSSGMIFRSLSILSFAFLLITSASTFANQEAHVHGEGHINLAIEGDRVYLELESPGADIVGFEYAAKSDAETAAVVEAIARLQDPMQIMRFDAAAGCRAINATTNIDADGDAHEEHGEHEEHAEHEAHDDDQKHEEHAEHEAHDDDHEHEEHESASGHNTFRAEYKLQCADIDALKSIEFTYFEHFPNAQILDIVLIQGNRQQQQEVDRSSPVLMLNR